MEGNDLFLRENINGRILTTEFQGYVQTIKGDHEPLWTTSLLQSDVNPYRVDHYTEEQALRIHNQMKSDLQKMN